MLGRQNASALAKAGIKAIAISSETATPANFMAIRAFNYRALVVSPEQLMKLDGEFERMLKDPLFALRVVSVIIDKAHCLTEWGEFRPEYKELGRLQYIHPTTIPLMITSAMLANDVLLTTIRLLHMHPDKMTVICHSTDCPNIKIGVRKIKYALNSFAGLAFLIPEGWKPGDPPLPKFLILFDDIQDTINAITYLC
ncbi:hypothetical protein PAXRUDRAFT_17707 [Paxillus rubicundulus Ve08.2h10]|uniref:DNA 3'-5' helicase n=1 Tax=Paxillus rubicundulus Ve08.2h10 TaxID=930991 RepID=A0A0D0D9I5_9AGAM|nr:hypothetical protein PAXRUDRAFT_17707 [Paxillus rubicundulus Ve08.2h10]